MSEGPPGGRPPPRRRRRRRRDWLGQLPAVVVLLVVAAGLVMASQGHWRMGAGVLALALVLASGLRVVLPPSMAGWLVVRSRAFDGALLLALGLGLGALAATIPRP